MNDKDKTKFKELIGLICESKNVEFSNGLLKIWWLVLKPHSIHDVEKAVMAFFSDTDRFMGGTVEPAHILKYITGTAKESEKQIKDKSSLAWAAIMRCISNVGPYRDLELEDKKAMAVVSMLGGWSMLCSKTYNELMWIEKEFKSLYDVYERTDEENLPTQLKGLAGDGQKAVLIESKKEPENIKELISQLRVSTGDLNE